MSLWTVVCRPIADMYEELSSTKSAQPRAQIPTEGAQVKGRRKFLRPFRLANDFCTNFRPTSTLKTGTDFKLADSIGSRGSFQV